MDVADDVDQFLGDSPASEILSIVRDSFYSSSGIGSERETSNQQTNSSSSQSFELLYDDQALAPPKITPVSGVLSKGKVAIRPIAFRPVVSNIKRTNQLNNFSQKSSLVGVYHNLRGECELEEQLREKESEINFLRQTMERNERVIIKVYQEKEKRLKEQYEMHLKDMCHNLTLENNKLQKEQQKLREDCWRLERENEATKYNLKSLQNELKMLEQKLEEAGWKMCEKTGEISLLKSQIKDLRTHQTNEFSAVKIQACQCNNLSEKRQPENNTEITLLMQSEISQLQAALNNCRIDLENERKMFSEEQLKWLREKDRVIHYQKQLQLNYVKMFRHVQNVNSDIKTITESFF